MPPPSESLRLGHAASAEATQLLESSPPSLQSLRLAAAKYATALRIYQSVSAKDPTLDLLIAQHQRLVRDTERKIELAERDEERQGTGPGRLPRRTTEPATFSSGGVGLASLAHPPMTRPGFMTSQTSLSPPSTTRGLPPFARLPPPSVSAPPPSRVPNPFARPAAPALSPLYSSTSSSDPAESFISVATDGRARTRSGDLDDAGDPFAKFWAMLDGALDNISRPVMGQEGLDVTGLADGLAEDRIDEEVRSRKASSTKSMSDSFLFIDDTVSTPLGGKSQVRYEGKTPEELALENHQLRASLDALAVHTQAVERENAALKKGIKGREDLLRSVVGEVRQNAERVRIDQSVLASQFISHPPSRANPSSRPSLRSSQSSTRQAGSAGLVPSPQYIQRGAHTEHRSDDASRVAELEAQVGSLTADNERLVAQVVRYKDRFERIKANAKAKKEAKKEGEGVMV